MTVLGLACVSCRLTIHKQLGQKHTQELFKDKVFLYCPICGDEATSVDNYNDLTAYDGAFLYGIDVDLYRQLFALYMDYLRETSEVKRKTFKNFLRELLTSGNT